MSALELAVDRTDASGRPDDLLLTEQTIDELLQVIVTSAGCYLVETYGASVTAPSEAGFETLNASSVEVRDLDTLQYRANQGPCVTAASSRQELNLGLEGVFSIWPALGHAMQRRDIGGVMSTPLFARRPLGTLNVYLDTAGPADEPLVGLVRGCARQAAALLSKSQDLQRSLHHCPGAEALETQDLVGQAKGILMVSRNVSAPEAFDLLLEASQRSNVKLRCIAQQVVDRRAGPGPNL